MNVRAFFDAKPSSTPRSVQANGLGSFTTSLAAMKNIRFSEERFCLFAAEAYNFLNKNNLSNPTMPRSSRDFGCIMNRFDNRTMQLGLRFVF